MLIFVSPGLLLSLLIALGYAALFHLWRGRTLRDLAAYLIASLLGFGAGQLIGVFSRTPLLEIGDVHLFEATLGAWLALLVVHAASGQAQDRRNL